MSIVMDEVAAEGCELIDGVSVEPLPMSAYSAAVANRLNVRLANYGEQSGVGQSFMDMFFRIPIPRDRHRQRKPDLAFVSFDRWPADRPVPYRGNPLDVVPDLMVEVTSPNDESEEQINKCHEYLQAGARLVWLVSPVVRTVHAYTSPTAVRVFAEADELEGGDVLPGFRVPMAQLFPPVTGLPEGDDE